MKIYFANVYGETVKHDIQLTVPYALVESGEESLALSQGFYKTYWDYPGDHFLKILLTPIKTFGFKLD